MHMAFKGGYPQYQLTCTTPRGVFSWIPFSPLGLQGLGRQVWVATPGNT